MMVLTTPPAPFVFDIGSLVVEALEKPLLPLLAEVIGWPALAAAPLCAVVAFEADPLPFFVVV